MKLITKNISSQEMAAVLDDADCLVHFYIRRPERLNLGEYADGIIRAHHPALRGYFVETAKKCAVFVPSQDKLAEGQRVCVRITKEARHGKDANGVFVPVIKAYPSLTETLAAQTGLTAQSDWDAYDLDEQLERALDKNVSLTGGGRLMIERTEACWTIDVDSKNATESFHVLNQTAIKEIARQVSLRHMGGLILIDFIGSKPKHEQNALDQALHHAFGSDSLTRLLGWTCARLYEIKRMRTYAPLTDVFFDSTGHLSAISTAYAICDALQKNTAAHTVVTAHPAVIEMLRPKAGIAVKLKPDIGFAIDEFDIKEKP
ncbi:MAG: ribonuclease E/G [Alphaproteobacteria bacterium]